MATFSAPIGYRVGDISVDLTRRVLRKPDGEELSLKPKAFAILIYLLENRDRLVTREELLDAFWKDTAVTGDALTQCITDVRRALADTPRDPRYLKTVPKLGFRFIGEVEEVRVETPAIAVTRDEPTVEIREEYPDPPTLPIPKRKPYLAAAIAAAVLVLAGIAATRLTSHSLPAPPAPPGGKRQIAILRFDNRTGQSDLDWLRDGLPDMLATTLTRSRGLDVVSREQVALWMSRSGSSGLSGALEVARHSLAEAAVIGTFERLGGSIRVDAQVYDGRSGALLAAESMTAEKPEAILREVDFLGARLTSRLAAKPFKEDREASSPMTGSLEAYRYYVLGMNKTEALHVDEAIPLFQKAIALDPDFAMAHARIGYAYAVNESELARGRPYLERAFRMSDKLGEKDRRHIFAWYAIANQDYPEAIRRYRDLIAAYPNETEAYYRLAALMRGESRQEEAVDLLRQALAMDPGNPHFYNSLSANLSEIARHDEAIEMAQRYLSLTPADANALDTLGLAYQTAGRFDEAEATFDKALALKPDFELTAIHRVTLYLLMGREKNAIAEALHRAQTASSNAMRSRFWSMIAWNAWRRGRVEDARAAMRHVQQLVPDRVSWSPAMLLLPPDGAVRNPETAPIPGRGNRYGIRGQYFYLAQEARLKGRTDEMLAALRDALRYRIGVADPEPLEDALADAELDLGKIDDAIAEYRRALKLFPGMARARYHLAQCLLRKGETRQAQDEFRDLLRLWARADSDLPELVEARRLTR